MANKKLKNIKYFIVDVDGTLTDSGIYYDENGNETKKFSTKDAAGFFALKKLQIKTIIITGRESNAVKKRLNEMKADYIFQNIKNKYEFLKDFFEKNNIKKEEVCYVGDDLNDLHAMSLAGFIACPYDSCKEVKAKADIISEVKGGNGAFRDIAETILEKRKEWQKTVNEVYNIGV